VGHLQVQMTDRGLEFPEYSICFPSIPLCHKEKQQKRDRGFLFLSCSENQVKDWDRDSFQGEKKANLGQNPGRIRWSVSTDTPQTAHSNKQRDSSLSLWNIKRAAYQQLSAIVHFSFPFVQSELSE